MVDDVAAFVTRLTGSIALRSVNALAVTMYVD